jgi:thioredoxin reductase
MTDNKPFDVIIIGGSYAGLSAAMAFGRALRRVLIIDSGEPCNKQTPHSHNFITHDGQTPHHIAALAKQQVSKYDTITFYQGLAIEVLKTINGFEVHTAKRDIFQTKKILFATGVNDQMPSINGFSACWGISVLHCPYCHGYEVKHQHIGILGNGDIGFDVCQLLSNWTATLTLFTNGKASLSKAQIQILNKHRIEINECVVSELIHSSGNLESIQFEDGTQKKLSIIFARLGFKQHCSIPEVLGCELTELGHLKIDDFQRTTVKGIFAAGDNSSVFRAVSVAVAAGTKAGAFINKELIDDYFF